MRRIEGGEEAAIGVVLANGVNKNGAQFPRQKVMRIIFYSFPWVVPQSNELTREPPELVQHFRL